MTQSIEPQTIDLLDLRKPVQDEYGLVADQSERGFHSLWAG
jgi:hypothetical protein